MKLKTSSETSQDSQHSNPMLKIRASYKEYQVLQTITWTSSPADVFDWNFLT